MRILRAMGLALIGAAGLLPVSAIAQVVNCAFNSHNYEVIPLSCSGLNAEQCWESAKTTAEGLEFDGSNGHLATITSADEQACAEAAWTAWKNSTHPSKFEVWIGGFQKQPAHGVADNWFWIEDEGAIPPPGSPSGYENWDANEPNDVNSPPGETGGEDHLGFGLGNVPTWNDEGAPGNIAGALIEYTNTTVIDVTECLDEQGGSCPVDDDTTFDIQDAVCDSADCTIVAQRFTFRDPRLDAETCGMEVLNLTLESDGTLTVLRSPTRDPNADSTLGRHLCGHPNIKVIKSESTGVSFGDRPTIVDTDPPAGNLYECGPPRPVGGLDNTIWDVTGYQTSDKDDMVETSAPTTGVDPLFTDNTVLETLFECGSSRGKKFNRSWDYSGLCIAFGIGGCPTGATDMALNPGNFDLMNQFLIYKLERIADVLASTSAGRDANDDFVRRQDRNYLIRQVRQAIRNAERGNYNATLSHIVNAQDRLATSSMRIVNGGSRSAKAELETRIDNAEFTSRNRIWQYTPPGM